MTEDGLDLEELWSGLYRIPLKLYLTNAIERSFEG